MYVDTDFLLALLKDDDWLGDRAEEIYREHTDEIWTSRFTLIELLMVAYREDRDVESVVVNAAELVEVRGDTDMVLTAASYVAQHGFTPFDAIHLVESGDVPIVSSDSTYDELSERICLEE
jgi:predicted nucleic acid-binding protein